MEGKEGRGGRGKEEEERREVVSQHCTQVQTQWISDQPTLTWMSEWVCESGSVLRQLASMSSTRPQYCPNITFHSSLLLLPSRSVRFPIWRGRGWCQNRGMVWNGQEYD